MHTVRLLSTDMMLHFQTIAQNDALDRPWFGEVWFLVDKNEWDVNYDQAQGNTVDPRELDLEPGQEEPELCFSRSSVRSSECLTGQWSYSCSSTWSHATKRSTFLQSHCELSCWQRKGTMLAQ